MKIEEDLKLDFSDVLIKPKRSVLKSRSQVNITRTFKTLHSNKQITGVPIIAANMDSVGTFMMSAQLAEYKMFTAIHKHYNEMELINYFSEQRPYSFYSMGITDSDYEKFRNVISKADVEMVCIDVANGYQESFVEFVKKMRDTNPSIVIMAGNVVTGEMTEALTLAGADIIKVGIGPGCFVPGTLVLTKTGLKPIEIIKVGNEVLTHTGIWQKVSNTFVYQEEKNVISINGIKSTKHHEYYVLNKKYKNIINDDNIHEYAEWLPAEKLTREYLLLRHNK